MKNVIRVFFPGGKRVNAEYKGHTIATDQPLHAGGEGTAPAPFDLFLASIATCAGFYVLSFCRSRDIPLQGTSLDVRTFKNEKTKRIERVVIDVQLPPEFPEKYMRAVIKSVDRCAVKEHLFHPPSFEVNASIQQ